MGTKGFTLWRQGRKASAWRRLLRSVSLHFSRLWVKRRLNCRPSAAWWCSRTSREWRTAWHSSQATSSSSWARRTHSTSWPGDLNLKPYRGFIAKYSSTASNEWVRTVNFGAYDVLWGVTTDSSGNIYAAGYTYTDGQDYWPWIFKYSADGDELWSLNISVSGATDAYVFGITLDGTTLTSVGYARVRGESRPLVVQASTSGTQLSAWYGTGTRILLSVDQTGTSGYFYATGIITPWQRALSKITASSIEWNADSTDHRGWDVSAQGGIPFVAGSKKDNGPPAKYFFSTAKYSSSGTLTWNRLHDESALLPNYDGLAIITDSSSNSYVSGSDKTLISKPVENPGAFIETWVIKGPAGSHDAMSLKYDSSGSLQVCFLWGCYLRLRWTLERD